MQQVLFSLTCLKFYDLTPKGLSLVQFLLVYYLFLDLGTVVSAQIVRDNTLPNNSIISVEENVTEILGGTTAGNNLFHSFEQFSLPAENTVWFNNAVNISNIIGRVTGSSISTIDGLIQANGTANLFLINPNGIIFGENSALDIGGSFIGSTADSLKFSNGSEFSAVDPQAPPLLKINIPVGLQYGNNNGDILVTGNGNQLYFNQDPDPNSTVNRNSRPRGLEVNQGRTLGLFGGNIILDGGNLTAATGKIELGAVADHELVEFDLQGASFSFDYSSVSNFKDISLVNASSLEVSGVGAGIVQLQGKEISITDGSAILADTMGDIEGGKLEINAADSLVITGTARDLPFISRLSTDIAPSGTANGGDIELNAADLVIADGAQVISSSGGEGNTGNLEVNANTLELSGGSNILGPSGLFTLGFGTGDGGDIDVNASNILVAEGAQVASLTFDSGDGGNISIKGNQIELLGTSPGGSPSGFFTNVEREATGKGGALSINTKFLIVKDGAQAASLTLGEGEAGILDIRADTIQLSGVSSRGDSSGLFSNVESGATGNGGRIVIDAESLIIQDGAQAASLTLSQGDAGILDIEAETIQLSGDSSGLFSNTQLSSAIGNSGSAIANGGQIKIDTGKFDITDGAQVSAVTFSSGTGGSIKINADEIEISGGPPNAPSGFYSTVAPAAQGDGGSLAINTRSLKVIDGGQIAVSTAGIGTGGNLTINADEIELRGNAESSASGIFGNAVLDNGDGGNLELNTERLSILNGATISASNFSNNSIFPPGAGTAGNIEITANAVELDTTSGNSPSSITASTNSSGGGNINLDINGDIRINNNSEIDAETRGVSQGGNITITANNVNLNRQGKISVDSTSSGNAGNIDIRANSLNAPGGKISATAQAAGGGNINLAVDFVFLDRSEISTSVFGGNDNGGNLEIVSDYVIAQDNSRIIAQATQGTGGNIAITTNVFLATLDTVIDASSESGIDGVVDINTLETGQQLDSLQLPHRVTDPTVLIADLCPQEDESNLHITGRGGLAENPSQNLRGESVWEDLRDFASVTSESTPSHVQGIVEAKAWSVNEKGNVELLSYLPQQRKQDYWALFNQCSK